MRKLFGQRLFWVVLALVLVGLGTSAVIRREYEFAALYAVFVAFAVARAAGWTSRF
jgi:hypothetical protein